MIALQILAIAAYIALTACAVLVFVVLGLVIVLLRALAVLCSRVAGMRGA